MYFCHGFFVLVIARSVNYVMTKRVTILVYFFFTTASHEPTYYPEFNKIDLGLLRIIQAISTVNMGKLHTTNFVYMYVCVCTNTYT